VDEKDLGQLKLPGALTTLTLCANPDTRDSHTDKLPFIISLLQKCQEQNLKLTSLSLLLPSISHPPIQSFLKKDGSKLTHLGIRIGDTDGNIQQNCKLFSYHIWHGELDSALIPFPSL